MTLRVGSKTDITQRILHNALENVWRLQSDLLGKAGATIVGVTRVHVELLHDYLQNVELFNSKFAQKFLICGIFCVSVRSCGAPASGTQSFRTLNS